MSRLKHIYASLALLAYACAASAEVVYVDIDPFRGMREQQAERGKESAKRDLIAGQLKLYRGGFLPPENFRFEESVLKRFHVEVIYDPGCIPQLSGYAEAYNGVSGPEILRRFGADFWERVAKQAKSLERSALAKTKSPTPQVASKAVRTDEPLPMTDLVPGAPENNHR